MQGEALPEIFWGGAHGNKENVLTRTDDFIKWFLPKIEKFPRNYKFLFGDRLAPRPHDFFPGRGEHVARGRGLAPRGFYIFQSVSGSATCSAGEQSGVSPEGVR